MAKTKSAAKQDWRVEALDRMRTLILEADPEMIEERKWKKASNKMAGVPVWSHDGMVCTGETYKDYIKLTFAKGAALPDPSKLFNASLTGGTRRAIDIHEGDTVNARAFKALVKAAVALSAKPAKPAKSAKGTKTVRLLSGGNPQIAKGDGDAPVQAYIAAMPGWRRAMGKQLDALIMKSAPKARKAVKWNSPFYGTEGKGWFLGIHVFTNYIKIAFFNGASLKPLPPVASKSKGVRYLNIREQDILDEAQFAKWVKQAAKLPGWGTV